ncbi:MAG: carboxypeptidase-like regulatory domain-containing protein [Gemmatimonadota bacterium]
MARVPKLRPSGAVTLVLCAAVVATPLRADAQVGRLVGEVRDIDTEQPIAGIAVKIVELELIDLTDRNGFFAFDSIPAGSWTFEASGFGYETNVEASEIGPRSLLLIRLQSDPLQLEGLYVSVVQSLVRRRMAAPSRVVSWDKLDLEAAIAPDIGSMIGRQGVAHFVLCGDEFSENDLPSCFIHRGRPTRLSLYIDDVVVPRREGMSRLWAYDPRDLWSVEFLPECAQLRVCTQHFMGLVESGRVQLVPMLCSY